MLAIQLLYQAPWIMTADAEAHGATEGEGVSVAYGTNCPPRELSCPARELSPEPDHFTLYGIRFLIRSIGWPLATDTVKAAKAPGGTESPFRAQEDGLQWFLSLLSDPSTFQRSGGARLSA